MDPRTIPSIMRGAIDLGALRERSAAARPARRGRPDAGRARRPAPSPPTADRPRRGGLPARGVTIIDVTEATFQTEVLERSLTTPVVIDFWAEWCGPCKQLSPVLEKLAIEGGGSWVLAKIDVDANPRIAQAFRVQGIPMVFAVVGGQPVDAFTGVVPESQLRPWIEAVLKAGGVESTMPEDPALIAADDALVAGDLDEAERAYKKILADNPADEAAQAGLAQVGLLRRIEGVDPAAALAAAEAAPDDLAAQSLAADVEVLSGQAERAYQRLVDLVRRTAGDERDKARDHLVSLFAMAAPGRPGRRGRPARARERAVLSRAATCAASPSSTPRRTSACGRPPPSSVPGLRQGARGAARPRAGGPARRPRRRLPHAAAVRPGRVASRRRGEPGGGDRPVLDPPGRPDRRRSSTRASSRWCSAATARSASARRWRCGASARTAAAGSDWSMWTPTPTSATRATRSVVGAAAGEALALVTGRGQADLAAIEQRRPYVRDGDVVVLGLRPTDEYRMDLQAGGHRRPGRAGHPDPRREPHRPVGPGPARRVPRLLGAPRRRRARPVGDAGRRRARPRRHRLPGAGAAAARAGRQPASASGMEVTVFDPDFDVEGTYARDLVNALVTGLSPVSGIAPERSRPTSTPSPPPAVIPAQTKRPLPPHPRLHLSLQGHLALV